jgi:dihydrodipicolinate synthase/N-acetylneuraminate lyase
VEVWNRVQIGDGPGARAVFDSRIAPINRIAARGWSAFYHTHKEILRQRGIIRTARVRGPIPPMDEPSAQELQAVIGQLYDRPV